MTAVQTLAPDTPLAAGTAAGGPRAFASFKGNRWPFSPAGRVRNSVRIAFVGDSMVYGQGVPYLQTLGPRVARHLNVARPGLWFDCQTFGLPGACAFHALARAESHAAAIEPDILIIALSQNDAYMLRPQPPTDEAVGQTWIDFAPLLAGAFADFASRWREAGRTSRVAVLYFDRRAQLGTVRPADVLRPLCNDPDLLFIDGSEPLTGYPADQIEVSSCDAHLNGAGHDKVARQVARTLLAQHWVPSCPDYDDPAWIAAFDSSAASLEAAGVPPAHAASEALNTLRLKWHDRRNRSRVAYERIFKSVEQQLAAAVRDEWTRLALTAFQHRLFVKPSIASQISDIEDHVFRANTLNFALSHAANTGRLQQSPIGLADHRSSGVDSSVEAVQSHAIRATTRAAQASDILRTVHDHSSGHNGAEFRTLAGLAARSKLANETAARGLGHLACVIPLLPDDADVALVLESAVMKWQLVDQILAEADTRMAWPHFASAIAGFAPERSTMTLHLRVIAAEGPELWAYRVGVSSDVHSITEDYVACGYLLRDGQAHTYSMDLPLMIESTISVTVNGDGMGTDQGGGALRLMPARLDVPGLPTPLDFRISRATRRSDTECIVEYSPFLFARSE